jgi:glycosyltransferase involved in cell wall biosynthesis
MERIDDLIIRPADYPDVIHCHHSVAFPAAAGLRQATGARLISTAHILMCSPSFPYSGEVPPETRESERNMCSSSDHVIAVSGWVRDSIVEELGIPAERIDVVHNGIDTGPQIVNSDILLEWQTRFAPNGERVIAYAGRLSAEKGVAGFIEAVRIVLQEVASAIVLIAGGYADEIEAIKVEIADDTFLSDHIRFLGWVNQNELLYLRTLADVVVIPSLYDPFPYAALESMGAGVPVVCSDAGGLPEMVEDRKSGLVVPLKKTGGRMEVDSSRLAEAIMTLLKDEALRMSLATSARQRVVTEFNIGAMASNIVSLYQSQ